MHSYNQGNQTNKLGWETSQRADRKERKASPQRASQALAESSRACSDS